MPLSWATRLALAGLVSTGLAGAQVALTGRVVDEDDAPVVHARVTAQLPGGPAIETQSGPAGTFRLSLAAPGNYLLSVDRAGYFRMFNQPVSVAGAGTEVTLVINSQREVFQSVNVGAMPTPVDAAETEHDQRLSGTEINDIPYPASHSLRNSMKLMPGVVQDPTGGLHFHGGAEYQTEYTLDGFDIANPIDGRFSTRLAVEGVRSLDLVSSREAPQYGRGSAGTLEVRTENGTDQFHYTATNFIPGVDSNHGLRIGDWTPRAGFSGPLVKGRAWFSDSFDGEYNGGYITGLPAGQNTNPAWVAGNLMHVQVNLTPANILYADLLSNFDHQAHYGLGVLDPVSTTTSLSESQWLAAVKDSHSWFGGSMLEAGFAWQRTFRERVPEGTGLYIVSPQGRGGNYFVNSREEGRRAQLLVNYYPRAVHLGGRHQLQAGVDGERLNYAGRFQRSGYQVVGLSGLPEFVTTFQGSGDFERPNLALAAYVNDHWQPLERLTIDAGLREDWDELVRQFAIGPRVSAAWAPFGGSRTKITAGYALLDDATNLALFSRPLDQQATTVPYSAAGVPGSGLATTFVTGSGLRFPRYDKWSAGAEHDFGRRISGSVEWLRKRGSDGFVYAQKDAAPGAAVTIQPILLNYGFGGTYALTNLRRDAYDELALTARQSFGDQYGWMASYVHSRAVSNAVLDVGVDQPLQVTNNFGRMPWDAPNRLLGWGYFPLRGENWAWAFLADYRSGFPFPVVNAANIVLGAVDSHSYPSNFDLNLHVEKRFTFRGRRFAIRVGCNNVSAHRNPTAVNNVLGAPQYLQFYGDEGRHFVIRLRMFGRTRS